MKWIYKYTNFGTFSRIIYMNIKKEDGTYYTVDQYYVEESFDQGLTIDIRKDDIVPDSQLDNFEYGELKDLKRLIEFVFQSKLIESIKT
jgi:hypothetical protein